MLRGADKTCTAITDGVLPADYWEEEGKITMRNFEVTIQLSNGTQQKVRIQADDSTKARLLAEAQYGKGNVVSVWAL